MAGNPKMSVLPNYIDVPTLASPGGHYSHAVAGAGLVFISGQLPITADGVRSVDSTFEDQVSQVLKNVTAALLAAGTTVDRLVQVRVYIDDIENWPTFDKLYREWAGNSRPARAVVPTAPLHFGFKVEVEVIALQT